MKNMKRLFVLPLALLLFGLLIFGCPGPANPPANGNNTSIAANTTPAPLPNTTPPANTSPGSYVNYTPNITPPAPNPNTPPAPLVIFNDTISDADVLFLSENLDSLGEKLAVINATERIDIQTFSNSQIPDD